MSPFYDSGYFDNRYISANVPKTDQVKKIFALILGEMYPERLCLHILPDASLHISAVGATLVLQVVNEVMSSINHGG